MITSAMKVDESHGIRAARLLGQANGTRRGREPDATMMNHGAALTARMPNQIIATTPHGAARTAHPMKSTTASAKAKRAP